MVKMAELHAAGITDLATYNICRNIAADYAELAIARYRSKLIDAFTNDLLKGTDLTDPLAVMDTVVRLLKETVPDSIE